MPSGPGYLYACCEMLPSRWPVAGWYDEVHAVTQLGAGAATLYAPGGIDKNIVVFQFTKLTLQ